MNLRFAFDANGRAVPRLEGRIQRLGATSQLVLQQSRASSGAHWGASGMPRASVTWPSCRFFTSWASQRLVVVSSFSTWAKVLSFSWSGRHWRRASLALRRESSRSPWGSVITPRYLNNRKTGRGQLLQSHDAQNASASTLLFPVNGVFQCILGQIDSEKQKVFGPKLFLIQYFQTLLSFLSQNAKLFLHECVCFVWLVWCVNFDLFLHCNYTRLNSVGSRILQVVRCVHDQNPWLTWTLQQCHKH